MSVEIDCSVPAGREGIRWSFGLVKQAVLAESLHNGSGLLGGRQNVTGRHSGREFAVVIRAESAVPGAGRPAHELG